MIDREHRSERSQLELMARRARVLEAVEGMLRAARESIDLPGDEPIEPRFTRVTCGIPTDREIVVAVPGGSLRLQREEGFRLALAIALASTAINTDDGEKQE